MKRKRNLEEEKSKPTNTTQPTKDITGLDLQSFFKAPDQLSDSDFVIIFILILLSTIDRKCS